MTGNLTPHGVTPIVVALARALVESVSDPAVIVCNASIVVAANQEWLQLPIFAQTTEVPGTLDKLAARLGGIEQLTRHIRSSTSGDGAIPLVLEDEATGRSGETVARWRQLGSIDGSGNHLTLIVLEVLAETQHLAATVREQSARINHLLVRQTLIEETERRRLGLALHDNVAQGLAQVRHRLAEVAPRSKGVTDAITLLDDAIASIRDLAFEFSPPVLDDLGLLPTLRWLADDLNRRYHTSVSMADDGIEPRFSKNTRTVAFRAVRELAINAAKHAPDAEIVISSLVNHRSCRLTVRDTGPGFEYVGMTKTHDGRPLYGLLSVEQQVLALGGSFELVSIPGEGTRAVLTLPLTSADVEPRTPGDRVGNA